MERLLSYNIESIKTQEDVEKFRQQLLKQFKIKKDLNTKKQIVKRQLQYDAKSKESKQQLKNVVLNTLNIPKTKKEAYGCRNQFEKFKNPAIEPFQQSVGMICQIYGERLVFRGSATLLTPSIVVTCAHCIINLVDKQEAIKNWNIFKVKKRIIRNTFFYIPPQNQGNFGTHKTQKEKNEKVLDSDRFFKIKDIIISPGLICQKKYKSDWAIIKLKDSYQKNSKIKKFTNKSLRIVYNPYRAKVPESYTKRIDKQSKQLAKQIKNEKIESLQMKEISKEQQKKIRLSQLQADYIVNLFNLQDQDKIIHAYYVGFYPKQESYNSEEVKNLCTYTPEYAFQMLRIQRQQIFHKISTASGSSGGPLIKSLQVGINEFRIFFIGVHRCYYQNTLQTRGGAILDGDFKQQFEQWIKQDIPPLFTHQFISMDQFNMQFKRLNKENFDQQIIEDVSCQRIMDMVKYIIQLFNKYLFFVYDWVKNEEDGKISQKIKEIQKKQIEKHFKSISLVVNNQFQFCKFDFRYIPLKNILEHISQKVRSIQNLDLYIAQHLRNNTHDTAKSLSQFIGSIHNKVPHSHENSRKFLSSLNRYIKQHKYPGHSLDFLAITTKLIKQYTFQSVTKLLQERQAGLIEFSLYTLIQQKIKYQHNPIDFFVKHNSVHRISILADLLKHRYANRIQELNQNQKNQKVQWYNQQEKRLSIINQYVHNYNRALKKWIKQNCITNNYYFYLQLKSQHLFSTQFAQQSESMRTKLIMLTIFQQYYNGKNKLDQLGIFQNHQSKLLTIIIKSICEQVQRKLTFEIASNSFLSEKNVDHLIDAFQNQIRKQFVSLCLVYHKQCKIKFNTAIFQNLRQDYKNIYQAQLKLDLQECKNIGKKIDKLESQMNQKNQNIIGVNNKKLIKEINNGIKQSQQKIKQLQKQNDNIKSNTKINQLRLLMYNKDNKDFKYQKNKVEVLNNPEYEYNPFENLIKRKKHIKQQQYKLIYQQVSRVKYMKTKKKQVNYYGAEILDAHIPNCPIYSLDFQHSDNQIYYSHIGVIRIKDEQLSTKIINKYDSYGTGTLVGKGIVLTAYHVISQCITYKKFDEYLIRFELRGYFIGKVANVIKVQYSEKFDWALLYLQKQLIKQPIFTLITHNINTEISRLVGKSYFCQIVGFSGEDMKNQAESKAPQELLSRSQGRVFIDDQYSRGLKYTLSTTQKMSGSPLIIYPTGEYGQKPYILCIHIEGADGWETVNFRRQEAKYLEEKFNYGSKIIKDILFKKYPQYLKEKPTLTLPKSQKYQIQTIHQNSYQFSTYFYERNKTQFISSYYDLKNIVTEENIEAKEIQNALFNDFQRFAECGIILEDMDNEQFFYFLREGIKIQNRQLLHITFNPTICLLQSKFKQKKIETQFKNGFYKEQISRQYKQQIQKEYQNIQMDARINLQKLFQRIVLQHFKQRQISQILINYQSQKPNTDFQNLWQSNVQYKRPVIIEWLSDPKWNKQGVLKAIADFEEITNKCQDVKGEIYYQQFVKNRSQLIQLVDYIEKLIQQNAEDKYTSQEQTQIWKRIFKIARLFYFQLLTEKKIEFYEYLEEQKLNKLQNIDNVIQMYEFLIKNQFKQKHQLKLVTEAWTLNRDSKVNHEVLDFKQYLQNNYNNLQSTCYLFVETMSSTRIFDIKTLQYLKNPLKLLILKATDEIRIITEHFLQKIVPLKQDLLVINSDNWNTIQFPDLSRQLSLQTYKDELYLRARRLKEVDKIQTLKDKEILVSNIMNLQSVFRRYLDKYEKDFIYYKGHENRYIQGYLSQQRKPKESENIKENQIINNLLEIYNYPKQKSLLNVSKIILQEISLFSLLNSDMEAEEMEQVSKFKNPGKIYFRKWNWMINNNRIIRQKQQGQRDQPFIRNMNNNQSQIHQLNRVPLPQRYPQIGIEVPLNIFNDQRTQL